MLFQSISPLILLQICLTLIVVQCFLLTHCFSFRTICITLLWNPALFVSLPPILSPFHLFPWSREISKFLLCVFSHWLTYIQLELFCESSIFLNSRVKYLCIEVKYTLQIFIFVTFMQHILSKFCTLKYQFLYPSFKTVKNMRTNGK